MVPIAFFFGWAFAEDEERDAPRQRVRCALLRCCALQELSGQEIENGFVGQPREAVMGYFRRRCVLQIVGANRVAVIRAVASS